MKLCVSHVASGFHKVGQTSYCTLSLVKTRQTSETDLGVCLCGTKRIGIRCGSGILVACCLS